MKARRLVVALCGWLLVGSALSHAMLERALPRVGSRVAEAPNHVELWFSEPLEAVFSTLQVFDESGRRVDRADMAVDEKDRRHVTVSLPTLSAGRYRVAWRAVSVDTHVTSGDFQFEIDPTARDGVRP
jgi:methionine-rich copper-binding protein CopC